MSGGGSGYNWMAPSLQSQDISFSIGAMDSASQESTVSSLLFDTSKMKPPKRPFRPVGDSFGKTRLKPDGASSQDPQEEQRRGILKLKKRFIRDRRTTSDYFAKTAARRNVAREVIVLLMAVRVFIYPNNMTLCFLKLTYSFTNITGISKTSEGSKRQPSGHVQEVQGRGAARHPDQAL